MTLSFKTKKKKNPRSRFQLFNSLLFPYFTLLCSLWRQYLQSLYYIELFIKKHKLKEREVNFRYPSYCSPWACGIWPIIGIFLIWVDEYKNKITWFNLLPPSTQSQWHHCQVHLFHCWQSLLCCNLISCQCPDTSHCWLASSERTLLLQAWISHNCLYFLTLTALHAAPGRGG